MKKIIVILILMLSLALFALESFARITQTRYCENCWTEEKVTKIIIGWGKLSFPVQRNRVINETKFYSDFFGENHIHGFKHKSTQVVRAFSRLCAVGADRNISFVCVYYEKEKFREYIKNKIKNKELTREKAFELISTPRSSDNTELQNEKNLLIKSFSNE